jgi:Ca2+:H+ antiporter
LSKEIGLVRRDTGDAPRETALPSAETRGTGLSRLAGVLQFGPFLAGAGTLAVIWGVGHEEITGASLIRNAAMFTWLFAIVLWCAVGVMRHAEALAHRLGEPRGTLILTLSAISIEVSIIAVMMVSGESAAPTLARDAMFSILLIILGGLVGFALLAGGFRHRIQVFNLEGARSFMVVLLPLATIALILPNYTLATEDATLSPEQGALFAAFTLLLYGIFLFMQTRRHREYFEQPETGKADTDATPRSGDRDSSHEPEIPMGSIPYHAFFLFLTLLPIPLLGHELDHVMELAVYEMGVPHGLKGVIVAALVLTPEGITAVRAAWHNQMQRAVNLMLGSALSTVSLTVPAVLAISLFTGHPIILGLDEENSVLLILTLLVSSLTFAGARTDMLKGAVHLLLFAVFIVLIIVP